MKGNVSKLPLWIAACAMAVLFVLLLSRADPQGTASQQERRIAQVLSSMKGAGRVEVVLYYAQAEEDFSSSTGEPAGALVVAEGANDMAVRLSLIRAVRTLLGLPENAVDVFMMEADGT